MPAVALVKLYNRFVDALGADYQKLRRLPNARVDSPESIEEIPPSHPAAIPTVTKDKDIFKQPPRPPKPAEPASPAEPVNPSA